METKRRPCDPHRYRDITSESFMVKVLIDITLTNISERQLVKIKVSILSGKAYNYDIL